MFWIWVYYLKHQSWHWVPRFECYREFKKMVEIGPRRLHGGYNLNNKQIPPPFRSPVIWNRSATFIDKQSEQEYWSPYLRWAWRSLSGPLQSGPQPRKWQGASERPPEGRAPGRFLMRLFSLERFENMV